MSLLTSARPQLDIGDFVAADRHDIHVDASHPAIARWFDRVAKRPGVQRGQDVIHGLVYAIPPNTHIALDDEAFSISFGEKQYADHFRRR